MSRYERRMGTGQFAETDNVKLSPVIENEKEYQQNVTTEMIIEDVERKNNNIMESLKRCTNKSERILLNHELRLNTIELSVDCINEMNEPNDSLIRQVAELTGKLTALTQLVNDLQNENVTVDITDMEKKVNKNVEDGPHFD
tara:strand:- start:4634 stop:5059 length:426 start_codon:yes stop_codon:yes gene_type:complete